MHTPSSKYLTYKHTFWQGCTLQEIIFLSIVALVGIIVFLIILPGIFGMPSWIGVIVGGVAIKPLVKLLARKTGEWKKNKPYGFLITVIFIHFADWGLITLPYVRRIGCWRTFRRIRRRETSC